MVCSTYNTLHIFSPHPEPFEEDATDSDSFPPTTSSLPSPVNHTFSSPTSSHSSFNTTTVTSGESCFHPTLPHLFLSTVSFSFGPLLSPATLLYPPLLAALSLIPLISPSSPIVSRSISVSPAVITAKRAPFQNSLPFYL